MAGPMKTVSFKLPEVLDRELTKMARVRKSSRSALAREALESLASGKRQSVTEVAKAVVGSIHGPSDLSVNPRHMSGYGK